MVIWLHINDKHMFVMQAPRSKDLLTQKKLQTNGNKHRKMKRKMLYTFIAIETRIHRLTESTIAIPH